MKTIQDYIELARERNRLWSDRELGRVLNLSGGAVTTWRSGRSLPKEKQMLALAKLAGISTEQALFELSYWNADDEETRMVYKGLISNLKGVLTVLIIVFAALITLVKPAQASGLTNVLLQQDAPYLCLKCTLSHKLRKAVDAVKAFLSRLLHTSVFTLNFYRV